MPNADEIRAGFIDFFTDKGHEFVSSSSLVPAGDDTLLFANAGMNQFKDIFVGLTVPACKRAVNSQKCLRVSGKHNDLEQVGKDHYHHTFFEMLGNWSFDDYFKAETIEWAWQLLTQVWTIDPDKLWATVFAGDKKDNLPADTEAANLWTRLTRIPADRVLSFGKKDNFWEMGATGPCGPCSEVHIDLGAEACGMKNVPGHTCGVNNDCGRFIELWNLVFIQYNRTHDNQLLPLGAKHIDTGAGLERITAVLQQKKSNYDTDLFMPIIDRISDITGRKFTSTLDNKTDNAFRVIADHIRALTFGITDGATPSNESRGYCVRRILRRASRFGRELGMHEPFLYKLVPVVVDCLGGAFAEIKHRAQYVSTVIESEEAAFGRTLDRGIEIFDAAARRAEKSAQRTISGEDVFQLYDTYGFPLDLTELMARERNLEVQKAGFELLMEQQRERARAAQKSVSLEIVADTALPAAEDLYKYETDCCRAQILGFIEKHSFRTQGSIDTGTQAAVVLDKTCFYAEAGGQVGDSGIIRYEGGKFVVDDTIKIGDCVIHKGQVVEGRFCVGQQVQAVVGKQRQATRKNHTATHLLQWALQQVADKSAAQKGSFVGPDYLRFDFICPAALTLQQIKQVEKLVAEKIDAALPVTCVTMPIEKAKKLGAMALFGEKYGSEVRVVAIGAADQSGVPEALSREFCGGTHIENTASIGAFKIIKEESISAGVRRITALTGDGLIKYLQQRSEIVDELSVLLKVPYEQVAERVTQLIKNNKDLAKQLKSSSGQKAADIKDEVEKLLSKAQRIDQTSIIVGRIASAPSQQVRLAVDMLKKKAKSAAVVLGFTEQDKVTLVAGVTDDLVKKGLGAGDIVKTIAPIVDGGGGGRPQMAEAGGKNPAKLNDALKKAAEFIKEKLSGA
ncbi:MAG TPA: alanine--tRNA ligase [Sedimentisphaerales bacterium]|nr:alanine--tRNA ligase [Sedimentisphaerales bacterium]